MWTMQDENADAAQEQPKKRTSRARSEKTPTVSSTVRVPPPAEKSVPEKPKKTITFAPKPLRQKKSSEEPEPEPSSPITTPPVPIISAAQVKELKDLSTALLAEIKKVGTTVSTVDLSTRTTLTEASFGQALKEIKTSGLRQPGNKGGWRRRPTQFS